jgi:hypothetical protein
MELFHLIRISYSVSKTFSLEAASIRRHVPVRLGWGRTVASVRMHELGHLSVWRARYARLLRLTDVPPSGRLAGGAGQLTMISCGYSLFNDAASNSDYIASNCRNTMHNDQEYMWKDWGISWKNFNQNSRSLGKNWTRDLRDTKQSYHSTHERISQFCLPSQEIPNRSTKEKRKMMMMMMISQNTDHSVYRTRWSSLEFGRWSVRFLAGTSTILAFLRRYGKKAGIVFQLGDGLFLPHPFQFINLPAYVIM